MNPTDADMNLAAFLWSTDRGCTCGGVDIGVGKMHEPGCGDPRPEDVAAILAASRAEDRRRIAYLEAGLDAIVRVADPRCGCLSTCATRAQNYDPDCDCGYEGACDVAAFADAVVTGEENLDGAMRLWAAERGEGETP